MNFSAQKPNVMTITNVAGPENMNRVGVAILRECNFDVYFKNRRMDITIEHKGAHPKFWVHPDKDTALLCKLNNRSYSVIGELIMTKALDAVSVPHAKYLPAIVVLSNDETAHATLSPDIIKGRTKKVGSGQLEEVSGRSLASHYLNRVYDTQHGKNINYEHTVDFYTKVLAESGNVTSRELKTLRNDMLKQALLQALFVVNDLHEENIGFLVNKDTEKYALMPMYDYGSALQLDWNFKVAYNKSQIFSKIGTENLTAETMQRLANNLLTNEKNNVKFGIHTPLIEASTKLHNDESGRNVPYTPKSLSILLKELAQEMHSNKELREYYQYVKQQVDFYRIREYYANSIDPTTNELLIPESYIKLAESTFKLTCFVLDKEYENFKCAHNSNEHLLHNKESERNLR